MGTRYHELVIEGPRGWALGFIQGYLRSRGVEGLVLDAEGEGFDCEPLREQIKELLNPTRETLHLIAPELLVKSVQESLDAADKKDRTLTLKHSRPIAGARFTFSVSIYSVEHASRIRAFFEHLDEGVRLTPDTKFEEIHQKDGKGLEMYAPLHEFELRGEGGVEGDLDGVLAFYNRCRREELINTQRIELVGE